MCGSSQSKTGPINHNHQKKDIYKNGEKITGDQMFNREGREIRRDISSKGKIEPPKKTVEHEMEFREVKTDKGMMVEIINKNPGEVNTGKETHVDKKKRLEAQRQLMEDSIKRKNQLKLNKNS